MSSREDRNPAVVGRVSLQKPWVKRVLVGVEWLERKFKSGAEFFGFLHTRFFLVMIAIASAVGTLECLLQLKNASTAKKGVMAAIVVLYAAVFLGIYQNFHLWLENFFRGWETKFRHLHLLGKAAGALGVLVGFVYLSKLIEEHKGWNGFAISFYLFCYLLLTAMIKLYGREDVFGAADGLMAITIMVYVKFKDEKLGKNPWQSSVVYIVAFWLILFKYSGPAAP